MEIRRATLGRSTRAGSTDDSEPFDQFQQWREEWLASGAELPDAAVLATADDAGRPSARYVDLAWVDQRPTWALVFFTGHASRKARDLAANPRAELCFGWGGRQVRLYGAVQALDDLTSDEHYSGLPRQQKLLVWCTDQARRLDDPAEIEEQLVGAEARFSSQEVPRPQTWGGYRLLPEVVEFWEVAAGAPPRRRRHVLDQDRWSAHWVAP